VAETVPEEIQAAGVLDKNLKKKLKYG